MDGMTEGDVKRMKDLKSQRDTHNARHDLGHVELDKAATFAVGEGGKAIKMSGNMLGTQQKSYREKKSKKGALAEERAELQAKMLVIGKGKEDMGKSTIKSGAAQERFVEGHGWTEAHNVESVKKSLKKDTKTEVKEWSKSFKETKPMSRAKSVGGKQAGWLETSTASRDANDLLKAASRRTAVKDTYSSDRTRSSASGKGR